MCFKPYFTYDDDLWEKDKSKHYCAYQNGQQFEKEDILAT